MTNKTTQEPVTTGSPTPQPKKRGRKPNTLIKTKKI